MFSDGERNSIISFFQQYKDFLPSTGLNMLGLAAYQLREFPNVVAYPPVLQVHIGEIQNAQPALLTSSQLPQTERDRRLKYLVHWALKAATVARAVLHHGSANMVGQQSKSQIPEGQYRHVLSQELGTALLSGEKSPNGFDAIARFAAGAIATKSGPCSAMSAVALMYLISAGAQCRVVRLGKQDVDHSFLILSLGDLLVLCDPWTIVPTVCYPSEAKWFRMGTDPNQAWLGNLEIFDILAPGWGGMTPYIDRALAMKPDMKACLQPLKGQANAKPWFEPTALAPESLEQLGVGVLEVSPGTRMPAIRTIPIELPGQPYVKEHHREMDMLGNVTVHYQEGFHYGVQRVFFEQDVDIPVAVPPQ